MAQNMYCKTQKANSKKFNDNYNDIFRSDQGLEQVVKESDRLEIHDKDDVQIVFFGKAGRD